MKDQCKTIAMFIGMSRKYESQKRRQFTAWLIRRCRNGATPNDFTLGEWADQFQAIR